MPLYQYRCEECDRHFEEIRKYDDPEPVKCKCGSENVMRAITSHGDYQIKGNNSASTRPRRLK